MEKGLGHLHETDGANGVLTAGSVRVEDVSEGR